MEGIPPARANDNEDVIWALETAESLWKRNARVDAIVWLRRAAQEAAEAGDNDRASGLMVEAASLTESLGRASGHGRAAEPVTSPPPANADDDVDSLLATGDLPAAPSDEMDDILGAAVDALAASGDDGSTGPGALTPRPEIAAATRADPDALAADDYTLDESDLQSIPPPTPVPTGDGPASVELAPQSVTVEWTEAPSTTDDAGSEPSLEIEGEAPRVASPAGTLGSLAEGVTLMAAGSLSGLDLAGVSAFGGATERGREALVRAASVLLCAAGAELPDFALALVLEGDVDAVVGADGSVIARLSPGALLPSRRSAGVRFRAAADDTTVAAWTVAAPIGEVSAAVGAATGEQATKLLAWAQLATSPLAARLHEDVRLRLFARFACRSVHAGDVIVEAGQPVPGIVLVASGEVVIDGGQAAIRLGGFVFPDATLSGARATSTARAGSAGAIVLAADRRTTQELWATEPLLLELLSGS